MRCRYFRRSMPLFISALVALSALPVSAAPASVRFVTGWSSKDGIGGQFVETEELSLSGSMENARYLLLSDNDDGFSSVAAWDVSYEDGAESMDTFPEVKALDGDTFTGWMDIDGNYVDEDMAPKNGAVYTAVYDKVYHAHWKTEERDTVNVSDESGETEQIPADIVKPEAPDGSALLGNAAERTDDAAGSAVPGNRDISPDKDHAGTEEDGLKAAERDTDITEPGAGETKTASGPVSEGSENGAQSQEFDETKADAEKSENISGKSDHAAKESGGNTSVGTSNASQKETSSKGSQSPIERGNSFDGHYSTSDGKTGVFVAGDVTGWLTKAEDVTAEDGTPLYLDADGNVISFPSGYDSRTGVYRYVLHVTDTDGQKRDFGCTGNQTLAEVSGLMGYEVSSFQIRQAGADAYDAEGSLTLSDIVKLFQFGDIGILGYGEDQSLLGCAAISQTVWDYEYDVLLLKDDQMTLRTAEEITAETEEVKPDTVDTVEEAAHKKEADKEPMQIRSAGVLVYAGLGISMLALIVGYVLYIRKKGNEE